MRLLPWLPAFGLWAAAQSPQPFRAQEVKPFVADTVQPYQGTSLRGVSGARAPQGSTAVQGRPEAWRWTFVGDTAPSKELLTRGLQLRKLAHAGLAECEVKDGTAALEVWLKASFPEAEGEWVEGVLRNLGTGEESTWRKGVFAGGSFNDSLGYTHFKDLPPGAYLLLYRRAGNHLLAALSFDLARTAKPEPRAARKPAAPNAAQLHWQQQLMHRMTEFGNGYVTYHGN